MPFHRLRTVESRLTPAAPRSARSPALCLATLFCATSTLLGPPGTAFGQTLTEAVREAVQTSPQVMAALSQARASSFDVGTAQTAMNAQYGFYAQPGFGYVRGGGSGSSGDLGFQVTKPVYDGGRSDSEIARQTALLGANNQQLAAAQADVALQTSDAYLEVLKQQALLLQADDYLKQIDKLTDRVREIAKIDSGRSYDLLQVESRRRTAQLQRETVRGNLQNALVQLTQLVGKPVTQLAMPADPPSPGTTLGDALAVLDDHPVLLAARAQVAAAEAAAQRAAAWSRPSISVRGRVNSPQLPNGDRKWFGGYDVGLVSEWNPFDGGGGESAANAARVQVLAAEDQLAARRRDLSTQIGVLWSQRENRRSRTESLAQLTQGAEKVREAYWQQFQVGRRSIIDLLNAEAEAYQARVSAIIERQEFLQVRYRLIGTQARLLSWLQIPTAAPVPVPTSDQPPQMPERRPVQP